jgi:hypothetical protein
MICIGPPSTADIRPPFGLAAKEGNPQGKLIEGMWVGMKEELRKRLLRVPAHRVRWTDRLRILRKCRQERLALMSALRGKADITFSERHVCF